MYLRSIAIVILAGLAGIASRPTLAQDKSVTGQDTILPGTGPGTLVNGQGGGQLMEAASADAAAKRQGLKPVAFLASKMIGV